MTLTQQTGVTVSSHSGVKRVLFRIREKRRSAHQPCFCLLLRVSTSSSHVGRVGIRQGRAELSAHLHLSCHPIYKNTMTPSRMGGLSRRLRLPSRRLLRWHTNDTSWRSRGVYSVHIQRVAELLNMSAAPCNQRRALHQQCPSAAGCRPAALSVSRRGVARADGCAHCTACMPGWHSSAGLLISWRRAELATCRGSSQVKSKPSQVQVKSSPSQVKSKSSQVMS